MTESIKIRLTGHAACMRERLTKFSSGNLKRSELERPGLRSEDKNKWLLKKKRWESFIWRVLKGSKEPWIPYKMDTWMVQANPNTAPLFVH
jgi:hypothetical protein